MATYWVRNLGGTNKAAAVDEAHGMNVATFNASTFSENDRIFFSNIDGNITSSIILPSGGITLSSGPNQQTITIVHGADTLDACISNNSKSGCEIDGIDVTHPLNHGIRHIGTAVDCIVRNVDSGYSGNQAFQNENNCNVTYYDIVGHHCADDGFSMHGNCVATIYRGDFYSCAEGINIIDDCNLTCYDCDVWDITSNAKYVAPIGSLGHVPVINFIRGAITVNAGIFTPINLTYGKLICNGTTILQTATGSRIASVSAGGWLELLGCFINGKDCLDHLIPPASGGYAKLWANVITGVRSGKYAFLPAVGSTNGGFHRNLIVHDPLHSAGPGKGVYGRADVGCAGNIFIALAAGIERESGVVTSQCNAFHNCTSAKGAGVTSLGGDITANPLLNADYTLQAASPCIGAGVAVDGLTTDRSGHPTPGPCGASIGPHEYMSDTPEGYGMRALFAGTMPTLTQTDLINQVQIWDGSPPSTEISKVLQGL